MARDIDNPDTKEVEIEDGLPSHASDEEAVEMLLETNGGDLGQKDIVEATGWSDAKVSILLSEMEENGDIERTRIGRRNRVELPDEEPTPIEDLENEDAFRCVSCGNTREEGHESDCPQNRYP